MRTFADKIVYALLQEHGPLPRAQTPWISRPLRLLHGIRKNLVTFDHSLSIKKDLV